MKFVTCLKRPNPFHPSAMSCGLHCISKIYLHQAEELVNTLPDGPGKETPVEETSHANSLLPRGYTTRSRVVPGSTIGAHLRHILDHFRLLYASSPVSLAPNDAKTVAEWTVTYDKRKANDIDTRRGCALLEITRLLKVVDDHAKVPLDTQIQLRATIEPEMSDGATLKSSYGRELWFCCLHAVHHFALIRAICVEQGVETPHDFGVAPSTLNKRCCG